MTISTRQSVVNIICSNLHRQTISDLPVGPFQAYAEMLWSNRPTEKRGGPG